MAKKRVGGSNRTGTSRGQAALTVAERFSPAQQKFLGRLLKLAELQGTPGIPGSGPAAATEPRNVTTQASARGSSGTRIFAGFFSEEYLQELRGKHAADTYDKMRRSDGQVKMLTSAVINPILAATWEVEPGAEGDEFKADADLISHILFNDMGRPFDEFLGECLTFVHHGYSLFEVTHKVVLSHPKFGAYNGIRELGFRSQRTVHRWNLDRDTGVLLGVEQLALGDLQRYLEIPGEFVIPFAIEKEGDNYEGISLLRTCYGPWLRKQVYLKLMAIGMEKSAVPMPKATIPSTKQDTQEYENLIEVLENYCSSESGWVTIPEGWLLEFIQNPFDPAKCVLAIEFEDKQMTRAFVANFLELGMSGSGGSYSLALNQNDFFEAGVEQLANRAASPLNRHLIPQLVRLNRGPREFYPKLKHSGIRDKVGKELGELLKALAETQWLTPDNPTEVHLRKRLKLPPMSTDGQRKVKAPSQQTGTDLISTGPGAIPAPTPTLSEIRLAEKPSAVSLIEKGRDEVAAVIRANLKPVATRLVADIMRAVRAASPADKPGARRGVQAQGSLAYKAAVSSALASIATRALEQARREVPKKRGVRLHDEPERSLKLGELEKLPKRVQKKITAQTDLMVDSQIADMEKSVFFTFDHAEGSTDSEAILEGDLVAAGERVLESAGVDTGASNVAALITNEARNSFFFAPDVIDGIASFTFVNPDPVSPICEDLAGQTFAATDPEAMRYFPPLHHNCKSIWVPNPIGTDEPDITGLQPSKASLEKYVTLGGVVKPALASYHRGSR